jgi:hypothetical protein
VYFSAHLDCVNQNDGESCPGSADCSETRGKPLNKYLGRQTEEEICKSCKFLPTKLEAAPNEITAHLMNALEFSTLEKGGATFAYPSALSPLDWACINGLTLGRDRAESLKAERERQEERLKKKKAGQ